MSFHWKPEHVEYGEHASEIVVVPTDSFIHPVKLVQVMFSNVKPVAG